LAQYRAEKARIAAETVKATAAQNAHNAAVQRGNLLARAGAGLRSGVNRLGAGVSGFFGAGGAMGLMGPLAGAASAVGIGRGVAGTVRSSEEFAQAMASSTAIMKDVNSGMRSDMELTAHVVAYQTKYSAKEAAEAYYFLASAGLDAKQSVASLPIVARFAQAGMFDLSLATDLLTDAQSALGLTVKDSVANMRNMTRVGDVLVKANTLANASVQQFSESLTNKAGAAMRMVSKDVEEGVAVLAAFADQGLKGVDAGTAFNIVLRDLTTKAYENKDAFARFGIAVYDSQGNVRNMADIVSDLERALGGLSAEQQKAVLLQLGMTDKSIAFTAALIGTSDKIRNYESELRNAAGTMKDVADKQLPELTRNLNKMRSAWDLFKIEFGKPIASGLAGSAKEAGLFANTLATILDMQFAISLGWKAIGAQISRAGLAMEEMALKAKWNIQEAFTSPLSGLSADKQEQKARELADLYQRKEANAKNRIGIHEGYEGDTPGSRYLSQLAQMRMGQPTVGARPMRPQGGLRGAGQIAGAMRESDVDARKAYGETVDGLREQLTTFNMTAAAQEAYRLRQQGLSEGEIRHAMALWTRLDAMKQAREEQERANELAKQEHDRAEKQAKQEKDAMLRRARSAADSVKTAQEKFRESIREIQKWWQEGMISVEEYRRLHKKASEEIGKPIKKGGFVHRGVESVGPGQETALAYLATMKTVAEINAANNNPPRQSNNPQVQVLREAQLTNVHLQQLVTQGANQPTLPSF
jgi:TP901 family phage tail tape measure protein